MSASARPGTPAATQGNPVDLKHPQMPPKAPRPLKYTQTPLRSLETTKYVQSH